MVEPIIKRRREENFKYPMLEWEKKKKREDATEFEFDGINEMFDSVIKIVFCLKYIKIIFFFIFKNLYLISLH